MKVSEALSQLKVGDTVWVKGEVDKIDTDDLPLRFYTNSSKNDWAWLYKNDEIFLTEPVSKEVKIPECVGKWINYCDAQEFSLHTAMNRHCDVLPGFIADVYQDFRDWLTDDNYQEHEEIFARAWLDGFTVEPKRWVVKDRKSECVYELRLAYTDTTMVNTNKTGIDGLVFTDKSKAEAVATLVEGQVEEVAE